MSYTCSKCGQTHEELPSIGFDAPYYYYVLSDEDKKKYVKKLTSDLCVLSYEDQTDYFIRAVLDFEINGHDDHLQYGVWVSLSEEHFNEYSDNFSNPDQEGMYYGYLSSWPDGYEPTGSIVMHVQLEGNGNRPTAFPHEGQEHQLVHDYYKGITLHDAEARIKRAMGSE